MGTFYLVWQPAIQLLFAVRRGLLVPDEEAYRAADRLEVFIKAEELGNSVTFRAK